MTAYATTTYKMEISQLKLFAFSAIIVSIFFKWLIDFANRCRTLPPGPWGFPVVGYLPWLGKKPFQDFVQLAKKYGNIFSVNLGSDTVVVLNDWQSIKESLVDQPKAFSGRPFKFIPHSLTKGKDLVTNDGPVWKTQRNMTMHIFKNLGVGKKGMESRAMDVVHEVMDTLRQADGKVQSMESVFFGPILKTNWNLVSGNEVKHSGELKEFEKTVSYIIEIMAMGNPVNTFPWLRFVPPNGFGHWENMRKNKTFLSYLRRLIDEHIERWEEGKLDDFIDYYLAEISKHKAETGNEEDPYNVECILYTLFDLFLAGMDTTNGTCVWGFLHLALNPSIQKKAQKELDEVVGRQRLPNIGDMPRLPYTEAMIMEIHRVTSLVPFSLPHKTTQTVNLLEHVLPKDTFIIQNIYAVHQDPKLWDEPKVFNPERFLNANDKAKAPPYLMPFSIGPRICPGQSLAEMELRLIFSCLLHRFTFSIPQGHPSPSVDPIMGITVKPHPYSLHISKRED